MNIWKKTSKSLGIVKAKKTITISFETNNLPDNFKILEIKTSCTCTNARWDENKKSILIDYKPKVTPEHIKSAFNRNEYTDTKNTTVKYEIDGVNYEQVLNFIANVHD